MMDAGEKQSRRSFLDWLIALCSGVTVAAMALPGFAYLWPAAKGGEAERTEVPDANRLTPGQSVSVQVGSKPVIVVRTRSGFRAFSAICTHLGCLVKWEGSQSEFFCPCHAAVFDENGHVVSGPPPAPLTEYTVKQIGESVYVSAPA